jgi:hypothetical protein
VYPSGGSHGCSGAGIEVGEGLRKLELTWKGRTLAVLVGKAMNGRCLMHLYEIPREDQALAQKVDEFKAMVKGRSARARKGGKP